MKIAKIIKSNSHVDYAGRVLDRLDASEPPDPEHYRFGQFVLIPTGPEGPGSAVSPRDCAVGLIYNSQLVNPDFGRQGPRLSTPSEMNAVFSPDLLNEQGVLIGILLVGWMDRDGLPHQGVPRTVLPVNACVSTMEDGDTQAFHTGAGDRLVLHYYSQVMTHAGHFAQQLMLAVLDQLESLFGSTSKSEIALLRRTLNWQVVFQNKSL